MDRNDKQNEIQYSEDKKILYYVPENYDCTVFEIPAETCRIKSQAFSHNHFIEEIVFQGDVYIEECGFYCMEKLKSVRFSDKQKMISKGAFYGCKNLETIALPYGLTTIEDCAFLECGIRSLALPETLVEIGEQAFDHNRIETVNIPKSVTKIGKNIFGGMLKEIQIYDNIECNGKEVELDFFAREPRYIDSAIGLLGASKMRYGSRQEDNTYFSYYTIIVKSAETEEIINRVYMPGKSWKTGRENLEFAKYWNRKAEFDFTLFDERFPDLDNVNKAFYATSRLLNPNPLDEKTKDKLVKYLSRTAKDYVKSCIAYKTVADVSNFEQFGILKKSNIDDLIVYAKNAKKADFEEYLSSYKEKHFPTSEKKIRNVDKSKKETVKKLSKEVDKTSDEYMKKVWMIRECSDGTGWISRYKGDDTELVFPQRVGNIRIRGIDNRSGAMPPNYVNIKSIIIPDGYERIGSMAFADCTALEEISVPNTVKDIGSKAFMNCTRLRSIVLPEKIENINEWYGKWMFRDCVQLEDVYVLDRCWSITGSAAFRGCSKLKIHAAEDAVIRSTVKKAQFVVLTEEELEKLKK